MLLTPISKRKNFHKRVFIFILGTAFFLAGFVVNIISNEALFNYNLQIVPQLQANSILGSQSFLVFMNIVSNVFNPILCAGYIIIFYLLSYRKL